ncbi:unnamed protein product [Ectocarpus sp. CCAP 1310/34]|nr:unnamed protein product [Ectocarpus sp. CCAP 1310/34]
MDSDFLAKAASHVEKACMQDYGASDMTTLTPETPLDGEWDCDQQLGNTFSEGKNRRHFEAGGSDGAGAGDFPEGHVAAARAEALNDVLRPMDRPDLKCAQGRHAVDPFLRRTLLVRAAEQLDIAVQQDRINPSRIAAAPSVAEEGSAATTPATEQQEQRQRQQGSEGESLSPGNGADDEIDTIAAGFAAQDADGSGDGDADDTPPPSSKRLVRIWFALLELAWDQSQTQQGSGNKKARNGGMSATNASSSDGDARDVGLARKAAVAVLRSGPWSPEKNRELLVLQAQLMLGETFVEELRLAHTVELGTDSPANLSRPGTKTNRQPTTSDNGDNAVGSSKHGNRYSKKGLDLDPRTMGIATTDCLAGVSADVSGAMITTSG